MIQTAPKRAYAHFIVSISKADSETNPKNGGFGFLNDVAVTT